MFTIYHIAFTDFPCVVWASVKDDRHDGENPFIIIVYLNSIWADAHNLSQGTLHTIEFICIHIFSEVPVMSGWPCSRGREVDSG